jgi:hypothetical protein
MLGEQETCERTKKKKVHFKRGCHLGREAHFKRKASGLLIGNWSLKAKLMCTRKTLVEGDVSA